MSLKIISYDDFIKEEDARTSCRFRLAYCLIYLTINSLIQPNCFAGLSTTFKTVPDDFLPSLRW
jgi:hypothetical protein